MKAITKFALVALGVTLAGAGITATGIYSAQQAKEKFMEIPQITSEEELCAALDGEKQTYCLTNMIISGTPAEDPFELLKDDYLYIQYVKEICEKNTDAKIDAEYVWEYSTTDAAEATYASDIVLFDQYEVTMGEFLAVMNASDIQPEYVYEEYAEAVEGSYYPNQKGDYQGNIRYTIAALPMNSEVAMYAVVGEGEIVPQYNKDERCCIVVENTIEALRAYYGDDAGVTRILIGFMFVVPMGLLLFASVIIFAVTGTIAQKNEERKKAAQAKAKKK